MLIYDRRRARRSIFDTIAYRAASQVATILGYIVLVRAMPRQDFGIFSLLYSFIPVVSTVASLGLEQTLRRYQPEYIGPVARMPRRGSSNLFRPHAWSPMS